MKKRVKYVLTALLSLLMQQVMADAVSVANIEVEAGGQAEIVVNLQTNATNITGYQMSLYLPEGVTLQKDEDDEYLYELSSRHNKSHTFSINSQADGGLLLLCYSLTKKTIAAGSGELLRLPVNVAATAEGTLTAQLKTIKISDTSSNVTLLDDVTFTLTVKDQGTPNPPVVVTGYKLYPAEFSIRKGESETMSINLENEQGIIMAEFYMQLPEGITIATDGDGYLDATLNDSRTDRTHSLEVELGSDGLYHFLAYSNKNKPFIGNEGELISVTLNCDESVEAGEYQGTLKSILLSDADKQAIQPADLTFAIEVTDYIPGDVNDDRRINGMDIVEMVELIMSQGYSKAADLYPVGQPDGKVNGMDLVEEVELVMSQPAQQAAQLRMANGFKQELTLTPQIGGTLALGVTTERRYLMTQCLVQLGEGMRLDDVTTDTHHTAAWRDLGNGQYMVVAYSGSNHVFTDNDALFSLHCTGEGTVTMTDVLMADELRQECRFAAVSLSGTDGIGNVQTSTSNHQQTYDLQGRVVNSQFTVNHSPLKRGVYVVNGHKVVVK